MYQLYASLAMITLQHILSNIVNCLMNFWYTTVYLTWMLFTPAKVFFLKSYSWNFKKFILLNTVLVERRVKFLSPQTNSGVKRVAAKSSIVEEN